MPSTLNPGEEAQLAQTIEMFEVITQSQPHDYQSLEILKEAYSKLGREKELISTSKRIAEAYVQMGQLSSAILEYETILQRYPGDTDVQAALRLLTDRTRVPFLPLDKYDLDLDLARTFLAETCQRWCVLPFDCMSKLVLVATANPFNQQAAKELAEATVNWLLWYLVTPTDLVKNLRKVFR